MHRSFKKCMEGIRLDAICKDAVGGVYRSRLGSAPGVIYTCYFVRNWVCLKTKLRKQRGRARWVVCAVDLGVKYPFGFGGVYVRGRCVGVCHSMSPTSDPLVNMDVDPHVTHQRIPEVSTLQGEQVREQRKSFLMLPFQKKYIKHSNIKKFSWGITYIQVYRCNLPGSLNFSRRAPLCNSHCCPDRDAFHRPWTIRPAFPSQMIPPSRQPLFWLSHHKGVLPVTELHINVFGSVASSQECFPSSFILFMSVIRSF